jgi:hypothetical protein
MIETEEKRLFEDGEDKSDAEDLNNVVNEMNAVETPGPKEYIISFEAQESLNEAMPELAAKHIIKKLWKRFEATIFIDQILSHT